ncbi:MAG: four helix bundle protein [Kouleothrix sp.]|nr:four helix bundle protein [Kouleothrix sp.]
MGKEYNYRNLILWQRAQVLALRVIRVVQQLPNQWGNAVVARQIIASATSVSANIAEGHARFTPGAHRQHLSIAKGSAAETDSWLDLLHRLGHLSDEEEGGMHEECLWIMESLKSKILDLERYEQQKRGSLKESRDDYIATGNTGTSSKPVWPFLESDYS